MYSAFIPQLRPGSVRRSKPWSLAFLSLRLLYNQYFSSVTLNTPARNVRSVVGRTYTVMSVTVHRRCCYLSSLSLIFQPSIVLITRRQMCCLEHRTPKQHWLLA
ncbi:MAG: hypothetical protein ACI9LG_003566, partial [Moritella dasanensis]